MDDRAERLFFEIHKNLPRQGPGSFESTKRAFELVNAPSPAKILDVGCGPGKQTFDLLSLTHAHITALDFYPVFVDNVQRKIDAVGVKNRVRVEQGDMNDMPFDRESFDLIWAEGAIYIMGFKNGLEKWKAFLKPGGYIAVSEITWLKDNPPKELETWWRDQYPVQSTDANLDVIKNAGYKTVGHFILPAHDWWDDYYSHIEKRLPAFLEKFKDDPEALQVVDMEKVEMEMHRHYSDYYGYVFYVMQKV